MVAKIIKKFLRILFGARKVEWRSAMNIELPNEIINGECLRIGRRFYMREFGIINSVTRYAGINHNPKIEIGNDVYVGRYCQMHCVDSIKIGSGVVISEYVYISDLSHGVNPNSGLIMQQALESKGGVEIGEGAFIGFGAVILPGVKIGRYAVVGARAVVTKSCSDYEMLAGNPARVIKRFNLISGTWDFVHD